MNRPVFLIRLIRRLNRLLKFQNVMSIDRTARVSLNRQTERSPAGEISRRAAFLFVTERPFHQGFETRENGVVKINALARPTTYDRG